MSLKNFFDNLYSNNLPGENDFTTAIQNEDFDLLCNLIIRGSTVEDTPVGIASSFYNIANMCTKEYNKHKLAVALYHKALEHNNKDASIYNNLATTYKRLSDWQSAEKYYLKAYSVDKTYRLALMRLALLKAHTGSNDKALLYYKEYLKNGGNEKEAEYYINSTSQGGQALQNILNQNRNIITSEIIIRQPSIDGMDKAMMNFKRQILDNCNIQTMYFGYSLIEHPIDNFSQMSGDIPLVGFQIDEVNQFLKTSRMLFACFIAVPIDDMDDLIECNMSDWEFEEKILQHIIKSQIVSIGAIKINNQKCRTFKFLIIVK